MVAKTPGMAKTVIEFLMSVSLLLTIGLWLTAMFTNSWFVASYTLDNTSPPTLNIKMSLLNFMACNDLFCVIDHHRDESFNFDSSFPTTSERLIESITAVAIIGVCCLLVMLPSSCYSKKQSFELTILVLSAIAVSLEAILVIRMIVFTAKMSQNFDKNSKLLKLVRNQQTDHDVNYKFPYSILIAGIGCLVGTTGCVLRFVRILSLRQTTDDKVIGSFYKDQPPIKFTNLQDT